MFTSSQTTRTTAAWFELGLIACAISMAAVFAIGLTSRYSLNDFAHLPRQSIGALNQYNDSGAILFILTFVALFGLYGLASICVNRLSTAPSRGRVAAIIVGAAVIFNLVLLPLYPVNSLDIFEYVIRGRIASVYHLNPYIHTPSEISSDPIYEYTFWRTTVSPYGPLWTSIEASASRLAGDGVIQNATVFKLVTIAGYALTAFFIGAALWRR